MQLCRPPPSTASRTPSAAASAKRIGIARALALNPELVVADEPVSALDVSVQAQILNLMLELQDRLRLTYLFVAHDLSVVKHVSDQVAVMYVGRIVEVAETETLYSAPMHPYSEALLSAAPTPVPGVVSNRIILEREIADPANPPPGCAFHPRCRHAVARCREEQPELREVVPGRLVACLRARELTLRGSAAVAAQTYRPLSIAIKRTIGGKDRSRWIFHAPAPTMLTAVGQTRPAPLVVQRTPCSWLQNSRPTSPSAFSGR